MNVSFGQEITSPTQIRIFDIYGKLVVESQIPAGAKEWKFDLDGLSSGIYYCSLISGTNTITKSFVVVR